MKFDVKLTVSNRDKWKPWLPYISPHLGLRRVIVIWGWFYLEAKIFKRDV